MPTAGQRCQVIVDGRSYEAYPPEHRVYFLGLVVLVGGLLLALAKGWI